MGEISTWDEGPVRVLAIDRPERLNALAVPTVAALEEAVRAAAADPGIGAVVLTGVGEHFSAGGDAHAILDAIAAGDEALPALMRAFHRLVEEVWNCPLPVLAAVSGVAYGGGFNLALACDLVVCSADVRLCQVFLRRGLVPDLGGAYLLPRLVGMQRAKELMLLTPEIGADRASELGLVNAVLPDAAAALARAVEWGTELAQRPRFAVSLAKKLINASTAGDLHSSLELEAVAQTAALQGRAAREGFARFVGGRDAEEGGLVSGYDERPWLARYDAGQPADLELEHASALEMFAATARRDPDAVAVAYFDGRITYRELDELTDAFACALLDAGVGVGDRVALYLQNVPQFVIALVGAWKVGAIGVSVNPMNRSRELDQLLRSSGSTVLVCLEGLHAVADAVVGGTDVRLVVTTSELEYQTRGDERVLAGIERHRAAGTEDMAGLIDRCRGRRPPAVTLAPDDVALLTYTSGTTGPPKGAMNTHRGVVLNAQVYRQWMGLSSHDVLLGVAPLFHITGLIAHVATALLIGAPLVLSYRFDPGVTLDAVREHRATFTVGSITVFIALMNAPDSDRDALASLHKIWSGGAPIPPSTVAAFERQFGHYIHNIYGLTETTSPTHAVPALARAPVDETSGALSVGVPVQGTVARVVDDGGADVAPGEIGEIVISAPGVVPGYWRQPEESRRSMPGGALRTGDVGYMDADGWFYIVDRKKDQINAGGYKVWPREVEDVLHEHDAVREAAVVGVPDPYRGETVKAFVSLRSGRAATPDELVEFCRQRLAAYKYPRSVEVLDELPKTVSGKLLRRELRGRQD